MKIIKPNTIPSGEATLTRASTATYIDAAGVLQTAGVNVPRVQDGRLLTEAAATNLLTYSEQIDNAAWAKEGGLLTTANYGLAPDGASTADRTVFPTGTLSRFWQAFAAVIGQSYTFSIWLKSNSGSSFSARLYLRESGFGASYGTSTVVVTPVWQRFSVSAVVGSASVMALVYHSTTGDPEWDCLAWGAQAELGPMSSYIPTTTAAVTRAADVLSASTGLLVSNATETYATWLVGTTYAAGDRRVLGTSVYESLAAANVGHSPDTSPTWWTRIGPSNTWALLDDQVSTQTVQASPLVVAVATGAIEALAILGVSTVTARLVVTDGPGGDVVYDATTSMTGSEVLDWYEYFFSDPTVARTQHIFSGMPLLGSSVATLTLTAAGDVSIGHMAFGRVQELGGLHYGAKAGITDYSRKETDEFGTTSFVKRAYSKTLMGQVSVDRVEINRVQRLLYDLRATPLVWIGSDLPDYSEALVVFGFYKDFYCGIEYPVRSVYQLEIEGLI